MKILFVLENFPPHIGGVETLFGQLVSRLLDRGHEVSLVTTSHPERQDDSRMKVYETTVKNRYLFTLAAMPKVMKASRGVDLIHTTSYNAAPIAWAISRYRKIPCIITFHEYWGRLWQQLPHISTVSSRLHQAFERMISRLSFDRFVAVSESTRQSLIRDAGISSDRITVIYNGIEPLQILDTAAEDYFLYYGRCGISKGLDLIAGLVSDPEIIWPKGRHIKIITRDDGSSLYRLLSSLSRKWPARLSLSAPLEREDLLITISKAKAVLIPSYSEGFCFAAAETSAIGTPIIHSGRAALGEVVSGKQITMSSLSVRALEEALQRAEKDDFDESGLTSFPLEKCIEEYLELYQKILSS